MQSIGILGVGELTDKVVRGLRRGGFNGEILLSPRNQTLAQSLADECACQVLASNSQVVEQAQLLIVGVRPVDLPALAADVQPAQDQWVVSLVAGVGHAKLIELFPKARCVRLMLSYAAQYGEASLVLTPPAPEVEQLLAFLGRPVVLDNEQQFELATVAACVNGWFYFLLDDLQQWLAGKGLPDDQARQLVLGSLKDCLTCAEHQGEQSFKALGERIATPGTFTANGLELLNHSQAGASWMAACEVVLDALLTRST